MIVLSIVFIAMFDWRRVQYTFKGVSQVSQAIHYVSQKFVGMYSIYKESHIINQLG